MVEVESILRINPLYRCFIATGGIGTGKFFELRGNHTLGREESRPGHFLDRKDYCKLHIVSHYVGVLMGNKIEVFPVGMVGDDEDGRKLLEEMRSAGLRLDFIRKVTGKPTLFSFCFIYPDGSGGNMTTDDSASSLVSPYYIKEVEGLFEKHRGEGIACALPEVPVEARFELLKLGRKYEFFNVASFTSDEIRWVIDSNVLKYVDLLSINSDEARILVDQTTVKSEGILENTGVSAGFVSSGISGSGKNKIKTGGVLSENYEKIFELAVEFLRDYYPDVLLTVTCGKEGSWSWDRVRIQHLSPPEVSVKGTSGAGDAFLAGVICGLFAGFPLHEAHHLGNALSAMAVTSPHTINFDITPASFIGFLKENNVKLPDSLYKKLFI